MFNVLGRYNIKCLYLLVGFSNIERSLGFAEMRRFLIFEISIMRYLICEQLKFSNVTCVHSRPTRHPAKFCCNSLIVCIKMAFSKI